jgi:hypothetical protein
MTPFETNDAAFGHDRSLGQWLGIFKEMTVREFYSLYNYAFSERLKIFMEAGPVDTKEEIDENLGLYVSLCVKLFEAGHFVDDISDIDRKKMIAKASWGCDFLKGWYPEGPALEFINVSWDKTLELCRLFGYEADAVYKTLAPHHVFSGY